MKHLIALIIAICLVVQPVHAETVSFENGQITFEAPAAFAPMSKEEFPKYEKELRKSLASIRIAEKAG